MKKLCVIGAVCVFFISSYGQDLLTTTPIQVADGIGNQHPQLEILSDGKPAVTWTNPSTKSIYFSKYAGGGGFETPIQLNPEGFDVQSYSWSGPDLAIDEDNVYVVFRSFGYETGGIYLVKSTDNGASFGDTVRVDHLSEGFGQYPDVAVLEDTVYVTFMYHNDAGFEPTYMVARSVDGGMSFEPEVPAAELWEGEVCDCCQPEIMVNDERLIVLFRNNEDNVRDIKAVVSYDRGETFTETISVDDHEWFIAACPSTGPDGRFISDTEFIAAYKSEVGGAPKVFFNLYDLESDESVELIEVYSTEGTEMSLNYPQVAYADEMIGIVWEDFGDGTSLDVFFNATGTGDFNLDPSAALNLTAVFGIQSKPDIALHAGIFHVIYSDATDNNVYYLQVGEANSIQETELQFDVSFSPGSDEIKVRYNGQIDAQLVITDLQGSVIEQSQMNEEEMRFQTSKWGSAVYIVTLIAGDKKAVKRVVR